MRGSRRGQIMRIDGETEDTESGCRSDEEATEWEKKGGV